MNTSTVASPTATSPTVTVPSRLDADALAPHLRKGMLAFDAATRRTSLEPLLLDLVRLRASQINGCVYCVESHSRDALEQGEDAARLLALPVWQESSAFTARERAALAVTEAATRCSQAPVEDAVVDAALEHLTPSELAELVWCIAAITAWNVVGATLRPWSPTS